MHIEIQVALNFLISYLYNKLPRRRVNIFAEELEKALKEKFIGHWYPEKPFKGSAFRCLKTEDPKDALLEKAAKSSGLHVEDILENLPNELSIWIDPGEVSYRIGDKGFVKVLHSEQEDVKQHIEQEARKPFNPGAQCFKPIELVNNSLMLLSLKNENYNFDEACKLVNKSPTLCNQNSANNFNKRLSEPVTFTTATFAQTKFGSTKLKNHSKRNNRSPTDFHSILKFKNSNQMMNNQVFLDPTSSSEVTSTINYQNTSHMVNQNLNMDVNSATGKRCGFNPEIKQLPNLLYSRSNEDPKCDQTKPIMDENSNNHPVDYANRFNCDYAGKSRLYRHILVAN